jgi:hypothetical protein
MFACEAEDAFLAPAFRAPTEYQAFEIALLGASMVLDCQCQGNNSARGAPKRGEPMMIGGMVPGGDALPGELLQV